MAELIVVHGYPGAGKSTQATRLLGDASFERNLLHVSAGNQLRDIRTNTIASRYSDFINSPDAPSPLPDSIVNDVIFEPIEAAPNATLALIDGYPRHPSAIDVFTNYVDRHDHTYLGAVVLEITLQTSIDRITSRGLRPGEKMKDRSFVELGKKRFEDHKRLTLSAIDRLAEYGPVEQLDANDAEDVVWRRFRSAIGKLALS